VQITASGVRLKLVVPKKLYAQDELTRMTVLVRNVSHHAVGVWGYASYCESYNPGIEVLDAHGTVLYPPAFHSSITFAPSCPPPSLDQLSPGQELVRRVYTILRAPYVRATLRVAVPATASSGLIVDIATPQLKVRLRAGAVPALSLHTSPMGVSLLFSDQAGHGPLLYQYLEQCRQNGQLVTGANFLWTRATDSRITASCAFPARWEVVAGRLGEPVAGITYTEP
jgi:hypothetical protein